MMFRESVIARLRTDARSKIELILVKDGWSEKVEPQPKDLPDGKVAVKFFDSYVLRQWTMKTDASGNKYANIKEITLKKEELEFLRKAEIK